MAKAQSATKQNRVLFLVIIVLFAVAGFLLLQLSSASSAGVAIESESSVTTSFLLREDATASGGQYVEFGSEEHSPDSVPIPYIPPDSPNYPYDPSVIPEDNRIVTTLHGINLSKGQQLFTVDCKHSHNLYEDPIVFPGRFDKSHYHEFFGDRSAGANSTIQSIIDNPDNTCEVGADRSAYWVPVAYQDGQVVHSDNNKFYYKVGDLSNAEIAKIQPMPLGLRMVAAQASATSAQQKSIMHYYSTPLACAENKKRNCKITEPHTFETNQNTQNLPTVPNGDNGLRALIRFPQCWDGQHLWLPGTQHMAYPSGGKCPASHPNPLVQVQFNLGWTDATGGPGFTLDSGPWYTLHGDFINGWKPETFERLVDACTRAQRYCGLTKSNSQSCNSRPSVKNKTMGCIELRAGETEPRFFGKVYN